jgi:hypothetical protein
MGKMRSSYRIIVEKPEGKSAFGRARCSVEDNIKMFLEDIRYVWTGFNWHRVGSIVSYRTGNFSIS